MSHRHESHSSGQQRRHGLEANSAAHRAAVLAVVVTVSDRSAAGERLDASGPRAVELLAEVGIAATATIVPDGVESVGGAIRAAITSGARLVLTTGGTGLSPRDLTPEATRPLLQRELPGIAELLRREGARHTPMAVLSRGLAGIAAAHPDTDHPQTDRPHAGRSQALVVNLPGSVKAVEQGLAVLLPLVSHIFDQLDGGDH